MPVPPPTLLRRPAPGPYFHPPFFNFSDFNYNLLPSNPLKWGEGPNYADKRIYGKNIIYWSKSNTRVTEK